VLVPASAPEGSGLPHALLGPDDGHGHDCTRSLPAQGAQACHRCHQAVPLAIMNRDGCSEVSVRYKATSRWQRVFMTTMAGFFIVLETGAYFDRNGTQPGVLAFTSAFLAVLTWLGVRSSRMATLLADDDKVVVRALFRTRSWSWDQIDAFVVETRLTGGFARYRRRMLGIRQHDGRLRWLSELNCRPAKGSRRSWVDDAAATLNAYLSSSRSASAAST
jgi:hypothetical protein